MDRFAPAPGGGDLIRAENVFGALIISRRDGAIDFQAAEKAFDVIAFPRKAIPAPKRNLSSPPRLQFPPPFSENAIDRTAACIGAISARAAQRSPT